MMAWQPQLQWATPHQVTQTSCANSFSMLLIVNPVCVICGRALQIFLLPSDWQHCSRRKNGKLRYILGGKNFHIRRPSDISLDIDQGLVFVTDSATAQTTTRVNEKLITF
jgi:hypothetical protein